MSVNPGHRYPGITGSKDEKTGVTTVTLSIWVRNFSEAVTVGEPFWNGLMLESRDFANHDADSDNGGIQVDLKYNGITFKLNPNEEVWEFDTSFREEKIETHPDFLTLKEDYGWGELEGGTFGFSEEPPAGSNDSLDLGLVDSVEKDNKNPLFGVDTYLVFGVIARRRYTTGSLKRVLSGVGNVSKRLPGSAPALNTGDKNWLKMAPKITQVGDEWSVSEEFMLSKEGGWPPNIHKLIRTLS